MAMLTRAVRRLVPAFSLVAASRPPLPLPRRRMYTSKVHGIFFNYVDHSRPHLFARPTSSTTNSPRPIVDAMLDFLPDEDDDDDVLSLRWCWWSVLDHSDGLLLLEMGMGPRELCVCNPATRRWTLLPPDPSRYGDCTYIAFDPTVSPHYQVLVVPGVSNDARRCSMESEWPPTPWRMNVFSSRTGQWEERAFVRHGEPAGTVQEMLVDGVEPSYWGPNQRYAVCCQGALYIHCRGSFVSRLSLSTDTYQVIKTPSYNVKGVVKPYLGRSQDAVYFGIVESSDRLMVWILNESSGRMEWNLRYQNDLAPLANHLIKYDGLMNAPWKIHDVFDAEEGAYAKSLPKERFEWDSDSDDIFTIKCGAKDHYKHFEVLGFHPCKEVVYLGDVFRVVAYHLNNSKLQFLGYSRPQSYALNHTNSIYDSFVYTPCMVGELNEGNIDQSSS